MTMEKRLKALFKCDEDHSQQTTHVLRKGEASEFYFACRNGNIDTVKKLLPTIPYNRINELQPNGSTPLHAATYYGHEDIVRLLLHDYGCRRDQINLYGVTAYEEAQTDEIRTLFHRPSDRNRFSDRSDDHESIFKVSLSLPTKKTDLDEDNNDDDDVTKPNEEWLTGYQTDEEIKRQLDGLNGVKTLLQSRFGRCLIKQAMKLTLGKKDCGYDEEEYKYIADKLFGIEALRNLLDEHITRDHPEYEHARYLINDYTENGTVESLLKLYTMETPFYERLQIRINPLAFPIFMHLSNIKERHYQGECYRGMRITREEFNEYRWALKNKDSVISTAKFASTSIDLNVAIRFAGRHASQDKKISVLLHFNFPQACDTAINLYKIPQYQLPCISNFENEHEVLVAPRTFFRVTNIEKSSTHIEYVIHLENIPGEQRTVLGTLLFFLKQELKNQLHE